MRNKTFKQFLLTDKKKINSIGEQWGGLPDWDKLAIEIGFIHLRSSSSLYPIMRIVKYENKTVIPVTPVISIRDRGRMGGSIYPAIKIKMTSLSRLTLHDAQNGVIHMIKSYINRNDTIPITDRVTDQLEHIELSDNTGNATRGRITNSLNQIFRYDHFIDRLKYVLNTMTQESQ